MIRKLKIRLAMAGLSLAVLASGFGQAPVKILRLMVNDSFPQRENGELAMVEGFRKLSGIELRILHPLQSKYEYQVAGALLSGEAPDLVMLGANSYLKYAQAGLLSDLTALYDGSRFRKDIVNPELIDALKINGRLFGLPLERGNGLVTYVRADWLDKLGLKPPANYSDFLAMLRAFKNRNPDGLPPDRVIPFSAAGLFSGDYPLSLGLREFYQGADPDFRQVGGAWVDGMAQPDFIPALERLRAAYAEGLIDREILLNKAATVREKWNSGLVGAYPTWAGLWNDNLQLGLAPNAPGAKVIAIPAIRETRYIERPATVYAIPRSVGNPAAIFRAWFEFVLDGDKGQRWATFGTEGVFHRLEAGQIQWLPSLIDPKRPFIKAFLNAEIPIRRWSPPYRYSDRVRDSLAVFQQNPVVSRLIPFSEESLELESALNLIRLKYLARMVAGELSVRDGLAAYQKEGARYSQPILKDLNG